MRSRFHEKKRGYRLIIAGFLVNLFLALISLFTVALVPHQVPINLAAHIIIPLLLAYLLTRDLTDSLTLITINDIFLVGASSFFRTIHVPMNRAILLMVTMTIFVLYHRQTVTRSAVEKPSMISYTTAGIFFYAFLLPAWLVFYSVMVKAIPLGQAFGDLQFIFPVLLYFPITRLISRHCDILLGWIIGVSVSLSLMGLILSLGPIEVTPVMWANLAGVSEIQTEKVGVGIGIFRGALQNHVVSFIGFFVGLFIMIDRKWKRSARLMGSALCLLSFSVFVLKFFRGPLLAILLTLMLLGLMMILKRKLKLQALRLIIITLFLAIIALQSIYLIVPDYFESSISNPDLEEVVGQDRIDQNAEMMKAWAEAPILGQGAGATLKSGYAKEETGQAFELSYQMVLFRLGIVGFIIMIAPLLWLVIEFNRNKDFYATNFSQIEMKVVLGLLFSAVTICIAGASNPYVKTGFMVLIFTIFLALRKYVTNSVLSGRNYLR